MNSSRNCATVITVIALVAALPRPASGDLNIWTKPTGGYWEEPFWSLGVIPTNGQYVAIANEGSKTVTIGPTTTQNYPSNLTLYSLTISSSNNSHNVLLMNYAGLQQPFSTRLLTVASNSTMVLLHSSLQLVGGTGEGMSLGGEFDQDESSLVSGEQMDIGWIGPGIYNLKSGTLALHQMWLGGPYNGQFNQYGGSSRIGLLHLYDGGAYNYYGGDEVPTNFYFSGGTFFIRGGIHYQPIEPGDYVQTGGTNYGPIGFSSYPHGTYTLSNGISYIQDLPIGMAGHYVQWGGSQTVTGLVTVSSLPGEFRSAPQLGSVTINGGTFTCGGISLGGAYTQTAGTSMVHGGITIGAGALSSLKLMGGVLMDNDVTVTPSYEPYELTQSGGLHIITNELTIDGALGSWILHGVSLCPGAQMIVSNISILNAGALSVAEHTVTQSGSLRCMSGLILPGQGTHQFGTLQVQGISALTLPLNTNCAIRFRDSSLVRWVGTLKISNWSGSISGGVTHQIIFGEGPVALTSEQLSGIIFQDPQGLTPGQYPARILSTGEIVPNSPPAISLAAQPNQMMHVGVLGQSNFRYRIETSMDLSAWTLWTNGMATNGLISVVDTEMTNSARKFYRALLLP